MSLLVIASLALLASCASVPMAPAEQDAASKAFAAPPANQAGLYVYRDGFFGAALTKTLWVDGEEIGETAPGVFLHHVIPTGQHTLSTESEFGNNDLEFTAVAGKNHFFQQYIKFGVFVGGANVQAVSDKEGQQGVLECALAKGIVVDPAKAKKSNQPQP